MYYPNSENKGADQLREADLRLCFHNCNNPVFSHRGSYGLIHKYEKKYTAASELYEPRYEKTGFWHMRKQRRRSAPR